MLYWYLSPFNFCIELRLEPKGLSSFVEYMGMLISYSIEGSGSMIDFVLIMEFLRDMTYFSRSYFLTFHSFLTDSSMRFRCTFESRMFRLIYVSRPLCFAFMLALVADAVSNPDAV